MLLASKRFLGLAMLGTAIATPAYAHLGGPLSSITADKAKMATRANTVAMGSFTRHDLVRPNGGTVREYTNTDGVVFAVSWSGPGKPDLRTLLGQYFGTFQKTGTPPGPALRARRRAAQIERSDLAVQSGGHMGWFQGIAYVRSLAPAGFSASDAMLQP